MCCKFVIYDEERDTVDALMKIQMLTIYCHRLFGNGRVGCVLWEIRQTGTLPTCCSSSNSLDLEALLLAGNVGFYMGEPCKKATRELTPFVTAFELSLSIH